MPTAPGKTNTSSMVKKFVSKDVANLLATSGLAQRTYTIIGQGLVDKALSLRADERRALFEEAAGINHYKSRRAETLRRLQDTQRNLQRVHDILAEIKPRLTSLKRQATRARNYEQISTDLRHLLRIWYGYRWEQIKSDLRLARQAAETAETAWSNGRRQLLVHQENIEDVRHRINRAQQQVNQIRNKRDAIREQLNKARREVAILQERQSAIKQQLADIAEELPHQESQFNTAQAELTAATTELESAQTALQENQKALQQFNTAFQAQQKEIDQCQQKLRQFQRERESTQKRLAQSEGQIGQLQERLQEREAENGSQIEIELGELKAWIEELSLILSDNRSYLDNLHQQRKTIQKQRQELIRQLKKERQQLGQTEKQLNKQRNQIARMETRADMLNQMRRKEIKTDKNVKVVGQLASLMTIPSAYQPALAAALSSRLATVVLPDTSNLWQISQGQSAAMMLAALDHISPPPQPQPPSHPDVIGWANTLVTYQPDVTPLVHLLLGCVLIVQTAEAAYALAPQLAPGTLAVSLDGFVVHAGGLVEVNGRSHNILAREEEWRQARAELKTAKQTLHTAEESVETQRTNIQNQQNQVDTLQEEERHINQAEQEANQRRIRSERDLDRARQQQTFLQHQQDSRLQDIQRLQQRIQQVNQNTTTDQQRLTELDQQISHAQQTLASFPIAEATQQRQTLQQNMSATQTIVAGRQAVVDSRRTTLNQVNSQITRLKTRQASLQQQQNQLSLSQEENTQTELQTQLTRLETELAPLKERLAAARQEMYKLEMDLGPLQRHAHDLETRYTQTKVQLTQRENQIENLQERIKADLGLVNLRYDDDQTGPTPLPMGEVVEQLPQVENLPTDIENNIQNYRGQLHRMGAINPDAPTEYETLQERYEFMHQQIGDLNETEVRLRQIITELDELTSKAFARTVEDVNKHFGSTFTQLFGGGTAQLVLTDPDDLTISGVDILARLPNRREQGLSLLSGGERSLTAAALIFSLLKVSPTPFCVMDEVDAALDEANITRFRDLLRELSLRTQFIVITHNRGTVQVAQTIYGISMGTDSASQAISLKPEEYIKQEELL